MKKCISLFILFLLLLPLGKMGVAHNPFISKPEKQHLAPKPPIKNPIFVKIIIWQHQLREKMSQLVFEAKSTKNLKPILLLFALAFIYGMVHSAGPGHGKFIAMSYLISCGRSYSKAILFGNFIAFFHGLSGVVFVLIARLLMQRTITGTLEETTHNIQLISFGMIFLLGLFLLIRSVITLKRTDSGSDHNSKSPQMRIAGNPIVMALAVGVVPCHGVVLVMLFCLSMEMIGLGMILSFWIALGMAITITGAVVFGLTGKKIITRFSGRHEKIVWLIERIVEISAACAITILGFLFFMANL